MAKGVCRYCGGCTEEKPCKYVPIPHAWTYRGATCINREIAGQIKNALHKSDVFGKGRGRPTRRPNLFAGPSTLVHSLRSSATLLANIRLSRLRALRRMTRPASTTRSLPRSFYGTVLGRLSPANTTNVSARKWLTFGGTIQD